MRIGPIPSCLTGSFACSQPVSSKLLFPIFAASALSVCSYFIRSACSEVEFVGLDFSDEKVGFRYLQEAW